MSEEWSAAPTATDVLVPTIALRGVSRVYRSSGGVETRALHDIDLRIGAGEFVAIRGASGSGKTTLMNILGLLDFGFTGSYELAGQDVHGMPGGAAAEARNAQIGFIFQQFNLLRRATVLENVLLPAQYRKGPRPTARALDLIGRVGLAGEVHKRSNQLSGGQMQRVAIARALLFAPRLILADEPTGNLDSVTSAEIMAILRDIHGAGATIILITHEEDVAAYSQRVVTLRDGEITSDEVL